MLAILALIACAQTVEDVWADYDDALYLDGGEVEAACAETPESVRTFETVWTVEARWTNTALLVLFSGDEFAALNCTEGSGERGSDHCWWPMERGDVVAVAPVPVHVDCTTGAMSSMFIIGALSRHGENLGGFAPTPALDYGSSGT